LIGLGEEIFGKNWGFVFRPVSKNLIGWVLAADIVAGWPLIMFVAPFYL